MKASAVSLFFAAFCTLLLSWALPSDCSALDRCLKYRPTVIKESRVHLGMHAPAHLFLAQIEQESRCNESAIAFDGGMGLGQFMPDTARWIHAKEGSLREISETPAPIDPRWNIRAMILYDKRLYNASQCPGWYYAFRAYNGGAGILSREIARAGSCDIPRVENECRRKVMTLKNGSRLDMCRVNIEYPARIFLKSEAYK